MRIIRNDKFIQRRAKFARTISLIGLGVLLASALIVFASPQLFLLSYLGLAIGFVCSQIGIYLGNRYSRVDRPDEVLAKALKGFDDRYALYQYSTPGGNVLLTPNACLVFTVKQQSGPIEFRNGRWHHRTGWRRIMGFLTQENLGNPAQEVMIEAQALQRYLDKRLPDVEVPIQPVIVFGNPQAEVNAAESPIPALHAKKLKDWLRGPGKSGSLSSDIRQTLDKLFEPQDS